MKTRKIVLALLAGSLLAVGLTACGKEKGPAERAGEKIDQAAATAAEKIEETTAKVGEKMEEVGRSIQKSADEAKK